MSHVLHLSRFMMRVSCVISGIGSSGNGSWTNPVSSTHKANPCVALFVLNPKVLLTVQDSFWTFTVGRHADRFFSAEVNTPHVHCLIQLAASPAFLWHSGPPRWATARAPWRTDRVPTLPAQTGASGWAVAHKEDTSWASACTISVIYDFAREPSEDIKSFVRTENEIKVILGRRKSQTYSNSLRKDCGEEITRLHLSPKSNTHRHVTGWRPADDGHPTGDWVVLTR